MQEINIKQRALSRAVARERARSTAINAWASEQKTSEISQQTVLIKKTQIREVIEALNGSLYLGDGSIDLGVYHAIDLLEDMIEKP